jgi:hypothetical protein
MEKVEQAHVRVVAWPVFDGNRSYSAFALPVEASLIGPPTPQISAPKALACLGWVRVPTQVISSLVPASRLPGVDPMTYTRLINAPCCCQAAL